MSDPLQIIKTTPPAVLKTLEALATYRFLTSEQIIQLGIVSNKASITTHIWNKTRRKKTTHQIRNQKPANARKSAGTKRPFIVSVPIGSSQCDVHYLTKDGALELAGILDIPVDQIPYPTGGVQFSDSHATHRFAQVDFHINIRRWAEQWPDFEVLFADMDFDVTGSRKGGDMVSKAQIVHPDTGEAIKADGIFGIETGTTPLLYVLEIHNTTQTKAVSWQIAKYMDVLEAGAVEGKYNLDVAPFICSVHMRPNVLRGVKAFLMNTPDFQGFKGQFVFNTTEQLKRDFSTGWTFADDSPANPFPAYLNPNLEPLIP